MIHFTSDVIDLRIPLSPSTCENRRCAMSGSFNQRRVAETIRLSQQQWREGYELGKSGDPSSQEDIERRPASFRDGYYRGWEEFFGFSQEPKKSPVVKRMSQEETTQAQHDRGFHLGKDGREFSAETLVKCHPAFCEGYRNGVKRYEDLLFPDPDQDEVERW